MTQKFYDHVLSLDYKKIAIFLTILALVLSPDGPPNL